MKNKETLEEAIERLSNIVGVGGISDKHAFMLGTFWQQERSYSEEDMREAFIAGGNSQIEEDDAYGSEYIKYMEEWLEQFKKK